MQYDDNAEKYGYEGEMTPLKCDKLNAYKGDVTIPVYGTIADAKVYLKSEADKVIADLEKKIKFLQVTAICKDCNKCADGMGKVFDENLDELKAQKAQAEDDCAYWKTKAQRERHHKFKRCLAMAARCRLRGRLFGACGLYEKELWALKWHKRWLELADKFKEAK